MNLPHLYLTNNKINLFSKLCILLIFVVISTIAFLPSTNFAHASSHESVEQSENVEIEDDGSVLEIKAETFEGKSHVMIKKQFSLSTTDRQVITDEIIKKFSLDRDTADTVLELVTTDEKKSMDEKFEVNINIISCISNIIINRELILDTTDREKILDAITQSTQLTETEIGEAWELEIDTIKILVSVEKEKARVQIDYCDQKTRFILNTADETTIINEIKEKTGLREYKIPQIWKFQTDVVEEVKKPKTPEELRAEALTKGEEIFANAQDQLTKTEEAQKMISTGEGVPEAITGGGGCLIATATFGSEMTPQVQDLRGVRDNILLKTQSGTTFMTAFNQFYYTFSPTIAELERENPVFKEIIKATITPLLTSLSILKYVDIDSEEKVLFYGIGIILLNIGMYFVAPTLLIVKLKTWQSIVKNNRIDE